MKKIFFAVALLVMSSFAASAQQKFGYINSQELLSVMPQMVKADTAIRVYARDWQKQMETMGKEYEKKVQDYGSLPKTTSEAVIEAKQAEITRMQQSMQDLQQKAEDAISKKKAELMNPIIEEADKAIKDVAKAGNYDYVFDTSAGGVIYAKEGDNLLNQVKTKLGIK